MNKIKFNIANFLRNAPVGTRLYCTMVGWVNLKDIERDSEYPIVCTYNNGSSFIYFTKYGYYYNNDDAECVIFPSDTCRTWNANYHDNYNAFIVGKFDKNTLKAFDKVLVRDHTYDNWQISFFSSIEGKDGCRCANATFWKYCIPYNDYTKHLIGTRNEEPDYYKCD